MTKHSIIINSPIGSLMLSESGGFITHCLFPRDGLSEDVNNQPSSLLLTAKQQLDDYFAGRRKSFDLPLAPSGSSFQQAVWQGLQTIPYGETWSYQQLAGQVGKPNASRAICTANGKNPIWIIIPCHRVVRASGGLGGYAGGIDIKARLLKMESDAK